MRAEALKRVKKASGPSGLEPPIVYTRGAHLFFFFWRRNRGRPFWRNKIPGASFLYQGRGHTCCFFGAAGAPLFGGAIGGGATRGLGA